MLPKHNLRTCPVCGRLFSPSRKATRQIYCTYTCKRKAEYRRVRYVATETRP